MKNIGDLLDDDTFKFDTGRIKAAVEVAQRVQTWVGRNKVEAVYFEQITEACEKVYW